MSDEQKQRLQQDVEILEDLDLDLATQEVGLEDLNNGQGTTETGASIGTVGCCSPCPCVCGRS